MTIKEGLAALALFVLAAPLCAQDLERGRALYETHCGKCHVERLHDRARSKVHDIDDLRDFVLRWSRETRHDFTLDEIEDVVQHLNQTHYRFKPRARPATAG
jgi:hypothetical protein